MEQLLYFIQNYGYMAIYGLLALGIVGLPVPDEILMAAAGTLTNGDAPALRFFPALMVSLGGSMTGMLVSYALGIWVGKPFLHRYGKWIKLTPERLELAESWFRKYGLWAVAFGYFVPGIRNLTCYLSGVSQVKLWKYVLVAGSGAFIWCSSFLTLGHVIGRHAVYWLRGLHKYVGVTVIAAIIVAILGYVVYRRFRKKTPVRSKS